MSHPFLLIPIFLGFELYLGFYLPLSLLHSFEGKLYRHQRTLTVHHPRLARYSADLLLPVRMILLPLGGLLFLYIHFSPKGVLLVARHFSGTLSLTFRSDTSVALTLTFVYFLVNWGWDCLMCLAVLFCLCLPGLCLPFPALSRILLDLVISRRPLLAFLVLLLGFPSYLLMILMERSFRDQIHRYFAYLSCLEDLARPCEFLSWVYMRADCDQFLYETIPLGHLPCVGILVTRRLGPLAVSIYHSIFRYTLYLGLFPFRTLWLALLPFLRYCLHDLCSSLYVSCDTHS